MAALTGADIRRGDIFLCKSFTFFPNVRHAVIRAGQDVFDRNAPFGDTQSVHAELALSTGADPVEVVESTGEGLTRGPHDEAEAYVYRLRAKYPNGRALADAAGDVAEDLVEWTVGKATAHYNYFRAAFSVLRDPSFGPRAQQRIKDIGAKNYTDGFYCSMLATVCYQIAADNLKLPRPPIEADSMNMNPAALESYLRTHRDVWACVGIYNRPTGNVLSRWGKRLLHVE